MLSQKIKQARLAAGLSLDDCVDRLKSKTFSISKPALSQYENGKRSPNAKVLKMLGELFSVPPTWFLGTQPDFSITWYAYRAQATLGTKKRDSIEAYASHIAEKNAMVWSLFPEIERVNIPQRRTISAIEEADSVVADTRKRWNLGSDALENVTQTLETHGAMVVHYNQQSTARFDGLSALVNKRWPMLIVNSNVTADRLRFDLAHELGHILMDTSSLGDEKAQEFAAHRFASSFLIPGSVLKNEIGIKRQNLSLFELLLLKEKYGVSVGALLYASRAHGIVTDSLYTSLQKQLSARGWRKLEPAVFGGNEQPARMRQLVTRAVAENLMGVREAALLFPDMAAELHREFPRVDGSAEKLRKMPKKERDAILLKAAEAAAVEYVTNPDLIVGDADGYYEYN